jgi:hypothetical protein
VEKGLAVRQAQYSRSLKNSMMDITTRDEAAVEFGGLWEARL